MSYKVLNLYAGIGGNRKRWTDVNVTAVEWNDEIASVYRDFFPDDTVIVDDAHEYLVDHFDEGWDFIWSSPPCPTHSSLRKNFALSDESRNINPVYPDFSLYQEVVFLRHHFEGDWVVENVNPYYDELMPAQEVGRHLVWSNMTIPSPPDEYGRNLVQGYSIDDLQQELGFDLSGYTFTDSRKDQVLKNCVAPEIGEYILNVSRGQVNTTHSAAEVEW